LDGLVRKELLAFAVRQGPRASRVTVVPLEWRALWVALDFPDSAAPRVERERREAQVCRDHLEVQGTVDHPETSRK